MDVNHHISWFLKEACTFTICETEDSLNCILAKSFVTWVGIESSSLAPVKL